MRETMHRIGEMRGTGIDWPKKGLANHNKNADKSSIAFIRILL